MHPVVFYSALGLVLAETLILFVRPQWLTGFALVRLGAERHVTLPERRPPRDRPASYRDGPDDVEIPELPPRTDLSDAVLFAGEGGRTFALRRAYVLGQKHIWLVRIDLERGGREVLLRARQVVVPITLPIFLFGVIFGATRGSSLVLFLIAAPVMALVTWLGQFVFVRSARDAAIEAAFDEIEERLRRG